MGSPFPKVKAHTVYFEIFGKKMKTLLFLEDGTNESAIKELKTRIKIHAVKEVDNPKAKWANDFMDRVTTGLNDIFNLGKNGKGT